MTDCKLVSTVSPAVAEFARLHDIRNTIMSRIMEGGLRIEWQSLQKLVDQLHAHGETDAADEIRKGVSKSCDFTLSMFIRPGLEAIGLIDFSKQIS